jgi:hypothetical protein
MIAAPVREDADDVGAAADLFIQALLGTVDLTVFPA